MKTEGTRLESATGLILLVWTWLRHAVCGKENHPVLRHDPPTRRTSQLMFLVAGYA